MSAALPLAPLTALDAADFHMDIRHSDDANPLAIRTGVCQCLLGWHICLLCFLLRFGVRVC